MVLEAHEQHDHQGPLVREPRHARGRHHDPQPAHRHAALVHQGGRRQGGRIAGLEHAITIRRCDTEADFGQSSYSPICSSHPTSIYGNADDPDGIGPTSAVLVYTYVLNDGTTRTARKRMDGNNDGRWYYSVQIQAGANWDLNRSSFTFYIETTDRYGGTSRGGAGKTQATNC